ncbi:MAG TPA: B-box zinc finger protein [Bryobacteraceae bacterium]|nr:B-box zinc finger protein [Bryobacteraceae bacterium]
MNCVTHPELPAIAYCRTCGRALCERCQRTSQGIIYCEQHLPAPAAAPGGPAPGPGQSADPLGLDPHYSPYTAPLPTATPRSRPDGASPGLAFILGLIPGVGAIYNGQYIKGLIHVVILGVLIGILDSGQAAGGMEPLVGMLIGTFVFYMAFEAYHTAKKRRHGQSVDEFSSILPMHRQRSGFPVGPLVLIAVGVLFLMSTLGWLRFGELIRYWPVALIALGAYMLYERLERGGPSATGSTSPDREMSHEQR